MGTILTYIRLPKEVRQFYQKLADKKLGGNLSAAIVTALYRDSGVGK